MVIPENYEENKGESNPTLDVPESFSRSQREHRLPVIHQDCIMGNDNDPSDEEIVNYALFADCELVIFEQTFTNDNWRKAMNKEFMQLKRLICES